MLLSELFFSKSEVETVTVSFELRGSDTSAETVLGGSTVNQAIRTESTVSVQIVTHRKVST